MFAYLKGILAESHPSYAVVDIQGVGYVVFITCRAYGELPPLGHPIQLYTSFVVREFSHALYGFMSGQERDVFEALLSVPGIGPKLALSLIGHLTLNEMQQAVSANNLTMLCRVPGVGKKTAERLVVELKDKIPQMLVTMDPSAFAIPVHLDSQSQLIQDAMQALINLGYNQGTAQKAVKQSLKEMSETSDLALLITTSLKNI